MLDIALSGYVFAALAFAALAALMMINQRGEPVGVAVIAAASTSALWATALAWQIYSAQSFAVSPLVWFIVELLRDAGLLTFLAIFLYRSAPTPALAQRWLRALKGVSAVIVISFLAVTAGELTTLSGQSFDIRAYAIAVFLVLSILGLLFIEQIFRGTSEEQRWAIKFLCLGVGGAFAFDFYMYAEALLFHVIDANVWSARGYVNTLVVPLLAISAARNPHWKVEIVVSRQLIFHSVTLVGAGLYLLAMALTGYYIRVVGGVFGPVGQTVFLFSALVLLLVLMFSGELRARTKVFFNKHFLRSKYDYRDEWLRITEALSGAPLDASLRERALLALAQVVESTGGALYQRQSHDYVAIATLNMPAAADALPHDAPLIRFMEEKHWVIDLDEYARTPLRYGDLVLPDRLKDNTRAWAVVPLLHHETLFGFVVLGQPRAALVLNWEVRDLLLMTGRHIAGHLALLEANEALIEARQFEAFNRLSAYVVHDLKNLVAQLSLLVSNATRHRDNPAFMDDAIHTVANAAEKMNKLLGQLRQGRIDAGDAKRVSVHAVVQEAVRHCALRAPPVPTVTLVGADVLVLANTERLTAVLEHLIHNAQEATPFDGAVQVQVIASAATVSIAIIDNGCGMNEAFLREQLFKPFHTTKGNAGMGIGVYESREFVQVIGGRLEVASAVGQGTTFTLNLPVYGATAS